MIHIRENKILVAAGGLCSTCCLGDYPWISPPRDIEYSPNDCQFCAENETPLQITVRFSDITLCDGCYLGVGYYWKWAQAPDPNGLYLLDQVEGSSCQWRIIIESILPEIIHDRYTDSGCENYDESQPRGEGIITVTVTKLVGGIAVVMGISTVGSNIFEASNIAPDSECMTISTPASNDYAVGDCAYTRVWYNGTAEIREGDQIP